MKSEYFVEGPHCEVLHEQFLCDIFEQDGQFLCERRSTVKKESARPVCTTTPHSWLHLSLWMEDRPLNRLAFDCKNMPAIAQRG